MSKPLIRSEERNESRVSFKIPTQYSKLRRKLDKEAERLRLTLSHLLIRIIRAHYLDFNGNEKHPRKRRT